MWTRKWWRYVCIRDRLNPNVGSPTDGDEECGRDYSRVEQLVPLMKASADVGCVLGIMTTLGAITVGEENQAIWDLQFKDTHSDSNDRRPVLLEIRDTENPDSADGQIMHWNTELCGNSKYEIKIWSLLMGRDVATLSTHQAERFTILEVQIRQILWSFISKIHV